MTRRRWLALSVAVLVGFGTAVTFIAHLHRTPLVLKGAVLQQSDDTFKQSPIADVQITAPGSLAPAASKSDFSGYFTLALQPGVKAGQPITLSFHHQDYQPLNLNTTVGDQLLVVHLKSTHTDTKAPVTHPEVVVANVSIRYSVASTNVENIGTGVKVFQVANQGNVPCDHSRPCSPDGKWKAAVASATLDAGSGNEFRNARVSCIAGPCPFTKIDSDGFSSGGRMIDVSIRDWSDPTTFVLQAEVLHVQEYDLVRQYYPTIIGRTLNFTLPAGASGLSLQAETNGTDIQFPLGPNAVLSWADCKVSQNNDKTTAYRCELKPWCRFR